jgi:threonine dehydrogenase-like Zn-dependent dehydrogenase
LPNLFPKVAPGGVLLLIGVYCEDTLFVPLEFLSKEAQLKTVFMYTREEVKLLSRVLPALKNISSKLVSKEFPLEKLVDNLLELELYKERYTKLVMVNK